ncbi:transposase [Nonomuraea sp. NPDC048901]|uniref:transposase n=1 Tax=Nonomuraea sp. NPDC048901 TaxID=3155627 RepID=UPI0033C09DC7
MRVWRGPGGIEVEAIVLDRTPLYKITQKVNNRRYFVADCRTVRDVEQHVDLADLVEVIQLPVGRAGGRALSHVNG